VLISEISDRQLIEFAQQQFVADFYTQFNNIQSFETMLIDLAMQSELERCKTLTESLSFEIQNNIRLISSNKSVLENLAIEKACEKFAKQYDTQIANQIHITQEIWKEYKKADNSLDTIGFRQHTKQEEKRLCEKHETLTERYNSEKATLNDLYEKQKVARKTAEKYQENYFPKILSLSHRLNEIIQKYVPKTTQSMPQGAFFDMAISSNIHRICNNTIFENISETDFYTAINLLASDKILQLKQGEKTRACFLIYKMYESIKSDKNAEWRKSMLQQLDIDENYYKSKYKEPISEVPSRKSEQFAREIKELFS
jgi:hypothetical protein